MIPKQSATGEHSRRLRRASNLGMDSIRRCERRLRLRVRGLYPDSRIHGPPWDTFARRSPMSGVNKVILIGNLGANPEMRFTQGGTPVANLRLATTEKFTDRNGQKQEATEWHRVVLWGKQAEIAGQYL